MSDRSSLSSVAKALRVVKLFERTSSISVTEASVFLGVAPSSAHRILTTLKDSGFVRQQSGSRRYFAGSALIDVALGVLANLDLRAIASAQLDILSRELSAPIWLIMIDETHELSSDVHMASPHEWADPDIIAHSHLHTLASGKLFLAQRTPIQLDQLFPGEYLPTPTTHSIRTKDELIRELRLIRRHKFAVQVGEAVTAGAAVAVPIHGPAGDMVAALAVTGRTVDLNLSVRRYCVEMAIRSSCEITRAIASDRRNKLNRTGIKDC